MVYGIHYSMKFATQISPLLNYKIIILQGFMVYWFSYWSIQYCRIRLRLQSPHTITMQLLFQSKIQQGRKGKTPTEWTGKMVKKYKKHYYLLCLCPIPKLRKNAELNTQPILKGYFTRLKSCLKNMFEIPRRGKV